MKHKKFKGIIPAINSPCADDDSFLDDQFDKLARRLYRDGVHGLYVCGASGDGLNMHLDERKRAAEIAVQISHEFQGILIIHIGCSTTRDAITLAEHAGHIGAAAIASMPPFTRNYDQLFSYYSDIAKAATIPLLVYHVPMLTHHNLTLDQMLKLLDIEGVIGLKFTDWNLFFLRQLIMARPDITVFSGFDEILTPGLLYGADGGIGGLYPLFPRLFLGIYDAVKQGKLSHAIKLQNQFNAFLDFGRKYGLHAVYELVSNKFGLNGYCRRRPRITFDDQTKKLIEPQLQDHLAAIDAVIAE